MLDKLAKFYGLEKIKEGEFKYPMSGRKIKFRKNKAQVIDNIDTKGILAREAYILTQFSDYDAEESVLVVDTKQLVKEEPIYVSDPLTDFAFLPRKFAEKNGELRQIITYMAVMNHKAELLIYKRKGGEDRLHGQYSIGVGGHINPIDADELDIKSMVNAGLKRELREELGARKGTFEIKPMFYYQSDETEVDKVHICAAFMGTLLDKHFKDPPRGKFVHIDKIEEDDLENWSKILLREIRKMMKIDEDDLVEY